MESGGLEVVIGALYVEVWCVTFGVWLWLPAEWASLEFLQGGGSVRRCRA